MYIALSPLPVLFWGVDVQHYLRVLLPFILFGVGLNVMLAAERRQVDPAVVLDSLVACAVISTVWRAIYAVMLEGLSIDSMRWQILGPAIPFAFGYGAAGLYLGRRRALSVVALSVACVCALLSITRSYLITAAFVIIGLLIVDSRRRSSVRAARSALRLLAFLVPLAGGIVAITSAVRPNFVSAWMSRLFHHSSSAGTDITLLTRVAEVQGQLTALLRDAHTLLIGNGVGADYIWDRGILRTLASSPEEQSGWFAGHFTWAYSFFASGIVVGWLVPLVLIATLIRGFSAASWPRRRRISDDAVLAFSIYLAYLGQSFTAHVLYERYGALILGIVSGAILTYHRRLSVENRFLSLSHMQLQLVMPKTSPLTSASGSSPAR
jgi:hypothetical protein